MADLKLDYGSFKSLAGALRVYYRETTDKVFVVQSVKLWCFPAWGDTNACTISTPEDIADFDANLKPTAKAVDSADEAAAIDNDLTGGRRATKVQPFTKAGRNYIVTGRRFDIAPGVDTECDTVFKEERELQGAKLCVVGGGDKDYVDFFVVHPDPSIGVVLQWAETIFVKPGDGRRDDYITLDSKTLPPGLILRMVYHSAANNPAIVYIDFIGWR